MSGHLKFHLRIADTRKVLCDQTNWRLGTLHSDCVECKNCLRLMRDDRNQP